VFARRGFAATAISNITEAAEVSRPTFYVYFTSKEDVLRHVAEAVRDDFLAAHSYTGPIVDDQRALSAASVRAFLLAYRDYLPILQVFEEQAANDPQIAAIQEEIVMRPRRRTIGQIKRMIAAGATPAAPPEVIAISIRSILVAASTMIDREFGSLDEAVEHCTDLYLRMVGF
jgi:TetR/AcrR family transcriptional regulator